MRVTERSLGMANIVETEAKMRKRGKSLCRAGWATFAISLAMPVLKIGWGQQSWMCGWDCFKSVFVIAWDALKGHQGIPFDNDGWSWTAYYSGFAVANLVLLASPLIVRLIRRDLLWLRRFSY